jgi:hypothetical protein
MRLAGSFVLVTAPGSEEGPARVAAAPGFVPCGEDPASERDPDADRRFLQALLRVRAATRAERAPER